MDTNIGEIPALPAQVEAIYNDGTTGAVNVVWEEITADMVAKAGTFTVNGTTLKAKATYRVKFVDQGKTVLNIQPPAAITELANGTAKTNDTAKTAAALGLPATVELVTDAGSTSQAKRLNICCETLNMY
ncbi:Ig-like domain-containing protein [Bacillus sp. 3103sda1]|uniref:Ig-like domain-containing protein n=1 Tax=Bacillus sp. 3103sda1 TaxID=2953808 RepID=UPI0020A04096|nr:Ig-like domain-containing protein [Bacillus sp. 3103sda1]MCP1123340.1 Ig-like domain-containing protein [Bacillus sp. 3103sda1]